VQSEFLSPLAEMRRLNRLPGIKSNPFSLMFQSRRVRFQPAQLYLPLTYLSYFHTYFLWVVLNLGLPVATIWPLRPWLPSLSAEFPLLLYLPIARVG
jgi:hypothetical protein